MHEGLHHHEKRKKTMMGVPLTQTFWKGVLDVAIYPIGGLSLILTLPQVYEVWVLHKVDGISLITWSMWTLSSFFWCAYGAVHKATAIMFMQIGWIVLYTMVITGVLIFR
jgi:uncharacterized protein with PQ loop repeat